jgi:hypothetical protein
MLMPGVEVSRRPPNFCNTREERFMSDGNEERHESRVRLEQERLENLEDQTHIDDVDDGEPERPDS